MAVRGAGIQASNKQVGKLTNLDDLLAQNASKLSQNLSVRATLNNAVQKEDEKCFSKQVYAFFTNDSNVPASFKQYAEHCLSDDTRNNLALGSTDEQRPEAILLDTDRSVRLMQKSGLNRDMLRVIWQRVSRTSKDGRLCKFEFYIALALIAAHQQRHHVRTLEELLIYRSLPEPNMTFATESPSPTRSGAKSGDTVAVTSPPATSVMPPDVAQHSTWNRERQETTPNAKLQSQNVNSQKPSPTRPVVVESQKKVELSNDDDFGEFTDFQAVLPSTSVLSVEPAAAVKQVNHISAHQETPNKLVSPNRVAKAGENESNLLDFVANEDRYAALRQLSFTSTNMIAEKLPSVNAGADSSDQHVFPLVTQPQTQTQLQSHRPTMQTAIRDHLVTDSTPTPSNSDDPAESRTPSDWSASMSPSVNSVDASPVHRTTGSAHEALEPISLPAFKAAFTKTTHQDIVPQWTAFTSASNVDSAASRRSESGVGSTVPIPISHALPTLPSQHTSTTSSNVFVNITQLVSNDSVRNASGKASWQRLNEAPQFDGHKGATLRSATDLLDTDWNGGGSEVVDFDEDFDDFRTAASFAPQPVGKPALGRGEFSRLEPPPSHSPIDTDVHSQSGDDRSQRSAKVDRESAASVKDGSNEVENLDFRTVPLDFDENANEKENADVSSAKHSDHSSNEQPISKLYEQLHETTKSGRHFYTWLACVTAAERCMTQLDALIGEVHDELTLRNLCALHSFEATWNDLLAIYQVSVRIGHSADAHRLRSSAMSNRLLTDMESITQRINFSWKRLLHRCGPFLNTETRETESASDSKQATGSRLCEICLQPALASHATQSHLQRIVTHDEHVYHLECANLYLHQCANQAPLY